MIVKNKRGSKTKNRKGKSWRLLPPTRTGATPLRLVSGAAPVVAARHDSGVCADWGKKLEDGEDLKAKGLVKSWGHLRFLFIGLVKEIVASDRGSYPKKLGRWRGFLDQSAVGSFGVQG
jgi:hypothetical protein